MIRENDDFTLTVETPFDVAMLARRLQYINRMSRISVLPLQNVASHTFNCVVMMDIILGELLVMGVPVSCQEYIYAMRVMLYHDILESIVGDIGYDVKARNNLLDITLARNVVTEESYNVLLQTCLYSEDEDKGVGNDDLAWINALVSLIDIHELYTTLLESNSADPCCSDIKRKCRIIGTKRVATLRGLNDIRVQSSDALQTIIDQITVGDT